MATKSLSFFVGNPTATGTAAKALIVRGDVFRVCINAEKYGGGTPTAGSIYVAHSWSNTDMLVQVAAPGATWANLNHIAVTYDGSATGNLASIYLNGVLLTNSFTRAAVGTIDTTSSALIVGNDAAKTISALGAYAFATSYSVVLTAAEVQAAMAYGWVNRGLECFLPLGLDSPEPDWSNNSRTGTVTGATVSSTPGLVHAEESTTPLGARNRRRGLVARVGRRRSPQDRLVRPAGLVPPVPPPLVRKRVTTSPNPRRTAALVRMRARHVERPRIVKPSWTQPPPEHRPPALKITVTANGDRRARLIRNRFRHVERPLILRAALPTPVFVAATSGLAYADTHNLSVDLTFTTNSTIYELAYQLGAGLAAPASPLAAGWVTYGAVSAPVGLQQVNVALPTDDDTYTIAAFGADGVGGYSAGATVDVHALAAPAVVGGGHDYSLVQISSRLDALNLAVELDPKVDWVEGQAAVRYESDLAPDQFTVYDSLADATSGLVGAPWPPAGLPGATTLPPDGSQGKVVRVSFPREYGVRRIRAYQS